MFPCVCSLALITKHGSSPGYLSSWPYPYHYGASSSIWFTTLSRSFRNRSSGKDVDNHVIREQLPWKWSFVFLSVCLSRILWMVPIYSLDSVSYLLLYKQNHCTTHIYTDIIRMYLQSNRHFNCVLEEVIFAAFAVNILFGCFLKHSAWNNVFIVAYISHSL